MAHKRYVHFRYALWPERENPPPMHVNGGNVATTLAVENADV